MSETYQSGSPGPATDRHNQPVIDPTANVLGLVDAAVTRLNDLQASAQLRTDDLRRLEATHVRELANIRAEYQHELRAAETQRIDAIRAVDVQAVQQGRLEAETRARALETQVAASAEAMRSQVAAAAAAAATSLANALDPVQKDIADLRRAQYEAQGQKTQVVERQAQSGSVWAIVGGVVALIAVVGSLYFASQRNSTPVTPTITVETPTSTTK